jgi:serine/threonine protein kinase
LGGDLQTLRNVLRDALPDLPGGERLLLPMPDGMSDTTGTMVEPLANAVHSVGRAVEAGDDVRLLDFGLAQFDGADTLTAVGDVPGTLAYIAPERLDGGDATPQSDVWSVGVLLWEILSDRHPFWGVPIQEVARSIQAGAPPLATQRRNLPRRLLAAVDTEGPAQVGYERWAIVKLNWKHGANKP